MPPLVRLKVLVSAVCALAALLLPVATAQASGAHLDRAFGKGGIRYLPQSLRESTGAALVGDGRVLVGNENEVAMLGPSGRFDPTFGKDGFARLTTGPGSFGAISSFAVDAEGRPVLVGLSEKSGTFGSVVERLTPEGRPDPSFGAGTGYLLSNFGLPAPESGGPASTYLDDVAFDSAGRLLVMGRLVVGTRPGPEKDGPSTEPVHEAFVARLDESGQLDGSFGTEGVFRDKGIELLAGGFSVDQGVARDWSTGPSGQTSLYASHRGHGSILRLNEGGQPDGDFGSGGYAPYPAGTFGGPLLDQEDRTIAWGYLEGVPHRLPNGLLIRRLSADGSPDTSFGKGGAVTLRIPRFYEATLALDEEGGILIAASLKGRRAISESKELALLRLEADGRIDKSFGHQGMVRIPFPHGRLHPSVYLEGMDVRGDQAVIGASYCGACEPVVALVDLGSG